MLVPLLHHMQVHESYKNKAANEQDRARHNKISFESLRGMLIWKTCSMASSKLSSSPVLGTLSTGVTLERSGRRSH